MACVLHFLDSCSDTLFDLFVCDAVHHRISEERDRLVDTPQMTQSEADTLAIWNAAFECYATPSTARWGLLTRRLRIVAYRIADSHSHCLGVQLALMNVLSGTRLVSWQQPALSLDCTRLIHTLEETGARLDANHFAVYAIGTHHTLTEGNRVYGGHALILVQYRDENRTLVYRFMQCYFNHYSLAEFLLTDAAKPMGHDAVCDWARLLQLFVAYGVWDAEKDRLHETLFGVSLPELYNERLTCSIGARFHYAVNSVEKFRTSVTEFMAVTRNMKHFIRVECLTEDAYETQLSGQFEPLILSFTLTRYIT
jgi:hypothetical protein